MRAVEEHKPAEKRRALGRGLDSLLPSGPRVVAAPAVMPPPAVLGEIAELQGTHGSQNRREMGQPDVGRTEERKSPTLDGAPHGDRIEQIPLELIDENPYQTRRSFDPAALKELAESIKASGLAQPIVVRPGENGRYVLVLGERRCRASKLAGKTTVSAIVRRLGNEQAAEMTIVENLQREDLNCLEQSQAFARLSRDFNLTQEQIGQRTGVSRESVANYIRLLKLPDSVQQLVGEGRLGFSEAKLLLEAMRFLESTGIELLAKTAAERGLTVQQLKSRVDALKNPEFGKPEPLKEITVDPNVRAAQTELERLRGTRVRTTH